jgi:NadR type nicotinamide-nucleotide adenylyltransferase
VIRIAITGPEATGKSTLASALAAHFYTEYCAEYSREYFENRSYDYDLNDVIAINKEQLSRINNLIDFYNDKKVLFFDTESIVNRIWSEVKFGICPPEIMKTTQKPAFELYLLCYPDIDWEADPLREDEHNRHALFKKYEALLAEMNATVFVVKGNGKERLENVISYITERYPVLQ